MREILQLIEEMQAHQKQASRKSRQHRRQIAARLDQMQADIGQTRAGLDQMQAEIGRTQEGLQATREALLSTQQALEIVIHGMTGLLDGLDQTQAGMAGLDRSVSGLRADVDQLQAADSLKDEHLGRLARAMNTFVDGTEQRLVDVESRLERLEQRIA